MDKKSIKLWAEGRQAIYDYLSGVYLTIPSEEVVLKIPELLPSFRQIGEAIDTVEAESFITLFDTYAARVNKAQKLNQLALLTEELNMEFTALFMLGDLSVPFYESAFLAKTGHEVVQIQQDVYHFFHRRNLSRKGELNIPEDAIIHELDYLAQMSGLISVAEEIAMLNELLAEQLLFMDEHLFKWLFLFTEKALLKAQEEKSVYYSAQLLLTSAFVRYDYTILTSLLNTTE